MRLDEISGCLPNRVRPASDHQYLKAHWLASKLIAVTAAAATFLCPTCARSTARHFGVCALFARVRRVRLVFSFRCGGAVRIGWQGLRSCRWCGGAGFVRIYVRKFPTAQIEIGIYIHVCACVCVLGRERPFTLQSAHVNSHMCARAQGLSLVFAVLRAGG